MFALGSPQITCSSRGWGGGEDEHRDSVSHRTETGSGIESGQWQGGVCGPEDPPWFWLCCVLAVGSLKAYPPPPPKDFKGTTFVHMLLYDVPEKFHWVFYFINLSRTFTLHFTHSLIETRDSAVYCACFFVLLWMLRLASLFWSLEKQPLSFPHMLFLMLFCPPHPTPPPRPCPCRPIPI